MDDRVDAVDEAGQAEEQASSRRKFLLLGGAGAAALAASAAAVVAPDAASAADGASIIIGSGTANAGSTTTTLTTTAGVGATTTTFAAVNISSTNNGTGISGTANNGTGVYGNGISSPTHSGTGVHAAGTGSPNATGAFIEAPQGGTALVVNAVNGPLALLTQSTPPATIPPTTVTPVGAGWVAGNVVVKGGHLYYCYASGNGTTTSKWAKLSGGLVIFPAAKRAYDSRSTGGPISSGTSRTVSLATSGGVPAGATAVLINLTVTETNGSGGYLAVFATGSTYQGTSNINWSASGQTIANNATSGVNGSAQVNVLCGGGASTQFIIDVAGYYP